MEDPVGTVLADITLQAYGEWLQGTDGKLFDLSVHQPGANYVCLFCWDPGARGFPIREEFGGHEVVPPLGHRAWTS
jgi:hypothetical protein